MSAIVFGGASQMVGIELFGQHIEPWLIVFSIFAVNFRHVLYSAALGRHLSYWSPLTKLVSFFFLVDPVFAESERRVQSRRTVSIAWYAGISLPMYCSWTILSWMGARFGSQVIPDPHAIGLDFLLPIYFLGLVMGFRGRPRWLPIVAISAVASIIAYRFVGSPWHVSLGALAGIFLAATLPPIQGLSGEDAMEPTETI